MSSNTSPSATPTPQQPTAAGPSPEKVGKSFIKTYYKTLLTSPSQLIRFYQPDSTVSRGMEPSSPTVPAVCADLLSRTDPGGAIRDAFFDWAGREEDGGRERPADDEQRQRRHALRIDFERGAIDAQESHSGGILLVVTGHMYLPEKPGKARQFVHTFFLNNGAPEGKKKQFYVKNDVLRFLGEEAMGAMDGVAGENRCETAAMTTTTMTMTTSIALTNHETVAAAAAAAAGVAVPVEIMEEQPTQATSIALDAETNVQEQQVQVQTAEFVTDYVNVNVDDYDAPPPAAAVDEEQILIVHEYPDESLIAEDEPAAEEQKIDVITNAADDSAPDSPAASKNSDTAKRTAKRNRRKKTGAGAGGGKSSRSNSPSDKEDNKDAPYVHHHLVEPPKEDTPEKPKTPGSWASLVATGQPKKTNDDGPKKGAGRRSSPKSTFNDNKSTNTAATNANHDTKPPPQDRAAKSTDSPPVSNSGTANAPSASAPPSNATRTPEATLFIRNVPDATKESEIRALFEPIARGVDGKILGITLNPARGFCFVDFDAVVAVDAVVLEAERSLVKEPRTGRKVSSSFMAHGRVLDVERKVKGDNKNSFNRRGSRGRSGMRRSPPRNR